MIRYHNDDLGGGGDHVALNFPYSRPRTGFSRCKSDGPGREILVCMYKVNSLLQITLRIIRILHSYNSCKNTIAIILLNKKEIK